MAHELSGARISRVRNMTAEEVRSEGWSIDVVVLELDNGTILYPSCDGEGNGPGALFARRGNVHLIIRP